MNQVKYIVRSTVHFYRKTRIRLYALIMDGYCSQITDNLYLADILAAMSQSVVQKYKIKHMITCNIKPLTQPLVSDYMWIDAEDMPSQDLISYFDKTNSFIDNAINSGEPVLVHCIGGVSRSATICIAYLMNKFKKSFNECFEMVKRARYIVDPNEGFRRQLLLYEKMGWKVNVLDKEYRQIVLEQLASRLARRHFAFYTERPDAAKETVKSYFEKLAKTSTLHTPKAVYKCKKCRIALFTDINVISSDIELCNAYYIEPQKWMTPVLEELARNDIKCPQCGKKIGFYDISGVNCDKKCSKHANLTPAFKINSNDVDAFRASLAEIVRKSQTG